jgi:regulator of RNase E activity RraA
VPPGAVLVMDARRDARAATAGAILITRAMVRGAAGIVSDGGMRDSPSIAEMSFPVYAGAPSAPTNLIRHHAVDINVPIGCGDVPVYPGDIVVGDAEGVVIIPAALANEIAEEAASVTAFEDWVEAQVKAGRSIIGLYPPNAATSAEYEAFIARQKA